MSDRTHDENNESAFGLMVTKVCGTLRVGNPSALPPFKVSNSAQTPPRERA
jgi:hypothetical protein